MLGHLGDCDPGAQSHAPVQVSLRQYPADLVADGVGHGHGGRFQEGYRAAALPGDGGHLGAEEPGADDDQP